MFVSAGAGTGKTAVLVERFVRAVCDEGLDVESVLVITYTRKAAGELRSRIRAALLERGRPDLARELDGAWISTIHGFCARLLRAHPFAVGIDPALPRARRRARRGAPRRGVRPRARGVRRAGEEAERLGLLATYGAARLRKMLTGVYETLRSAGRPLVLELGEPADLPAASRRCARRPRACSTTRRDREPRRRGAGGPRPAVAARDADRPVAAARPGPAGRELRGGARRRSSRPRSSSPRRATGSSCRSCSTCSPPSTRRRRSASRRSTSRTSSCSRATCSARRAGPRGRAAPFPLDHGRRVPGHERAPVRADRPARRAAPPKDVFYVGDEFQSIYGFRHADVGVFRERRAAAAKRLPLTRELPLAARGARRGQPRLRRGVRRRLPAARGLGRVPRPGLRAPGRAARHRQGLLPRARASTGGGRRRSTSRGGCASSSTPARRRRARSCCCSPPAPTPSGTRRSCARSGCRPSARRGGATSASSRSSTCSCTCGCCATATTTRRSPRCSPRRSSASRTTRSC